ncbi:alpha-ketoacid dehydrogenase kinase [Basidiobolus meristosporus CBS 931.73]|uniref:Protein-serine/threonine kinase n=1 Tax=Basidiobolus meristosporus CBS 931.73 TaxID=1314790 RepID=A0A1Y1YYQ0_9FUNG|nr:alpha-ketoacid dehydrogenase kinase [Basidiobolus meristosporus CBS 931.73]|eukprot:ORY03089.1 alpha-ketoacid dehydrogenase kinase [Basidiobolus meristosporus CBS 931.73]
MTKIPANLYDKIKYFATFPQTGVSLRQMVKFGQKPSQGTLLRASQFLMEELPIRLAHRVVELENLPHGLSLMPSVIKVKNWYAESFSDFTNFPRPDLPRDVKDKLKATLRPVEDGIELMNSSKHASYENSNSSVSLPHRYYASVKDIEFPAEIAEYNNAFCRMIEGVKRRHDPVVTTIANGILEFKHSRNTDDVDLDIQSFLDRFYMSRIGIRMLIGQHITLQKGPHHPDHVGIICTKTNLAEVTQEAIDNAKFICEDYYGLFRAPEVKLICKDDLEFMYVPSHLHHMLFELLKNSLRAIVETYGTDPDDSYPPIKIIVAEGKEDITIKISDEGGGIPRSGLPKVWTYMYTTASTPSLDPDFNRSDFKAPLAGFGYGLPLSRLYSRYFGGDLKIISMEGYGTDAYLHLSRLSDSEEPLP